MNRIISPHQASPKNKTQARLDQITQILSGFQQSLIFKNRQDHLNNEYLLFLVTRIVEILSEAKVIPQEAKEFFNKQTEAFDAKMAAAVEAQKNPPQEEKETPNETDADPGIITTD